MRDAYVKQLCWRHETTGHAQENTSKRCLRSTTGSCYLPSGRFWACFHGPGVCLSGICIRGAVLSFGGSEFQVRRKACLTHKEGLNCRHSVPLQETTPTPV